MFARSERKLTKGSPPMRHPERREAESNSRRRESASAPRARRSQTAEGSKKRFLLACFEISNIVFRFSYASRQRRFRSRTRALFTLSRVNKVRLRTGLLSHRSPFIILLCSAQNDAYRGQNEPLPLVSGRRGRRPLQKLDCFRRGQSRTPVPTSILKGYLLSARHLFFPNSNEKKFNHTP